LRTTEDKLLLDDNGLPLDKASSTRTSFLSKNQEPELFARIQELSLKAHQALHFKDFSMYDIRVDNDGNPWILEANLFCSFGPKSVLSIQAEALGWTNKQLFQIMVMNALRNSL